MQRHIFFSYKTFSKFNRPNFLVSEFFFSRNFVQILSEYVLKSSSEICPKISVVRFCPKLSEIYQKSVRIFRVRLFIVRNFRVRFFLSLMYSIFFMILFFFVCGHTNCFPERWIHNSENKNLPNFIRHETTKKGFLCRLNPIIIPHYSYSTTIIIFCKAVAKFWKK